MNRLFMSIVAIGLLLAGRPEAQAPQAKANANTPAAKPAAIVNLNTATQRDLETLPGIGAATAIRIIEYRKQKGPFKKIEELMNVQGIGEKSFLKLKPQITVATKAEPGLPE